MNCKEQRLARLADLSSHDYNNVGMKNKKLKIKIKKYIYIYIYYLDIYFSLAEVIIFKCSLVSQLSTNSVSTILIKPIITHSSPPSTTVHLHQSFVNSTASSDTNLTGIRTAPYSSGNCNMKRDKCKAIPHFIPYFNEIL